MKRDIVFNKRTCNTELQRRIRTFGDQLLNSSTFSNYVHNYLDYLKADNEALYFYALNGKTTREATFEILKLFRMRVFKAEVVDSPYSNDRSRSCWSSWMK